MLVSVIIPNWNGTRLLPTCLDSLRGQSRRPHEVIVVDNASTDGSVDLISRDYPEVRIVTMPETRLFAGAVNAGIRQARGNVIALLNNDTEADPCWLAELCSALERHPEAGFCATKMLLFDRRNVINSAGDSFGVDGTPGNRGVWEEDRGQYDAEDYVFGACGGAVAYRRSMLDDIGLFDEDLVAYCEDVDLNFRAQVAGYRCLFVPTAVIYHRLSATGGGPISSYYCGRNFVAVLAKNVPGEVIRRHWPRMVAAQLGFAGESIAHFREPAARARLRGQIDGLRHLPFWLRKRSEVKRLTRVPDSYIESILTG